MFSSGALPCRRCSSRLKDRLPPPDEASDKLCAECGRHASKQNQQAIEVVDGRLLYQVDQLEGLILGSSLRISHSSILHIIASEAACALKHSPLARSVLTELPTSMT